MNNTNKHDEVSNKLKEIKFNSFEEILEGFNMMHIIVDKMFEYVYKDTKENDYENYHNFAEKMVEFCNSYLEEV